MTSPPPPQVPTWVAKRDGRVVPFEADKISRALFAATESLGHPDAFLARELTDGVVHFLTSEVDTSTPSTAQIRELVIKVVRELGQPALAQTFASHVRLSAGQERMAEAQESAPTLQVPLVDAPAELVRCCLREYTLRRVFARDLTAAHGDGLLTLTGLATPLELAGCVLGPVAGGLLEAIVAARSYAGAFVALDGPEYALAPFTGAADSVVAGPVRELVLGLRATGLSAVINLNCASPPLWAGDLAEGPLFPTQKHLPATEQLAARADAFLEALLETDLPAGRLRIDWHLSERDSLPGAEPRLLRVARLAAEGSPIAFVFDRPRRPILLAEGLDRMHPAVLLTVDLHLPQLADQPGLAGNPALFLQKLGSLARLALSAAVQKREFLRRPSAAHPDVTRGFLLPRARLIAAPVGLESVTRFFIGRGLCQGKPAVDFARQVVQRLGEVLRQDGRACLMETCLDATPFFLQPTSLDAETVEANSFPADQAAGLTAWDAQADVTHQLRAAGSLHAVADGGTAVVFPPNEPAPTTEQVADWLRWTWQQTAVARVRFLRTSPAHKQLVLGVAADIS